MTRPPRPNFVSQPLETVDEIPVFSATDRYVDNYRKIALDHLATMQPGHDNPYIENELWNQLDESTRELIRRHVEDGGRVLDVGVGLGRVLGPLTNLQRYGIDISHEYLRETRRKGIEVAFSRIEDMPYQDAFFDAVIACDVLEHVIDLHACTKQMLRVLRPNGLIILRVPYREDLEVYLQDGLPYEFIHLRNFDEHSIKLYFQKVHGCEIVEISTVAPHWQGETRLRYRLPSLASSIRSWIDSIPSTSVVIDDEGKSILRALSDVSLEALVAWINKIKRDTPKLFDAVRPHLLFDIEMNVVVKKVV
jgi:2-polyprenyl-3-methyl-5-hydroxy-6-metoxy-1,4-benzoquinol methylase